MTAVDIHNLTAQALELAGKLSGRPDAPGLETLCLAAARAYAARLKPGVAISDCAPALIPACACVALSSLAAQEGAATGDISSFRIGEVSMSSSSTGKTGGSSGRTEALRAEAERLMAPYVVEKDFAFLSIRNA